MHFFVTTKKEIEIIKEKITDWLLESGVLCEFQEKCDSEFHDHGYVDHPEDLCQFLNWVLSDKQNLYQYLFAVGSFVETGNDNSDADYPFDGYKLRENPGYEVFIK